MDERGMLPQHNCKQCGKPDTHIDSTERGYETLVCEACGARYTVKRS